MQVRNSLGIRVIDHDARLIVIARIFNARGVNIRCQGLFLHLGTIVRVLLLGAIIFVLDRIAKILDRRDITLRDGQFHLNTAASVLR